jgi:hypothetical protein
LALAGYDPTSKEIATRLEFVYSSESCMCSLASVSRTSYCELCRLERLEAKLAMVLLTTASCADVLVDVWRCLGCVDASELRSDSLYVADTIRKDPVRLSSDA